VNTTNACNGNIGVFAKVNSAYGVPVIRTIETAVEQEDSRWFKCREIELGISQGFNTGITNVSITGVTNSSGVAKFSFVAAAAIVLAVGQKVTISGFIANPTYNITGDITATDTTSSFEISSISKPSAHFLLP